MNIIITGISKCEERCDHVSPNEFGSSSGNGLMLSQIQSFAIPTCNRIMEIITAEEVHYFHLISRFLYRLLKGLNRARRTRISLNDSNFQTMISLFHQQWAISSAPPDKTPLEYHYSYCLLLTIPFYFLISVSNPFAVYVSILISHLF